MFVGFNYYRLQTKKLILHLYNISIDNAPLTSTICGLSPGACVVDMIVSAETWLTERTVATHCQGAPNIPHTAFTSDITTMSIWKPLPFFRRRSGLSIINLLGIFY